MTPGLFILLFVVLLFLSWTDDSGWHVFVKIGQGIIVLAVIMLVVLFGAR